MSREVAVADLHTELESLTYPVTREEAIVAFDDVTVDYGGGSEAFGDVLSQTTEEVFVSPEDLEAEVYEHIPEQAVDPADVEEIGNGGG
jgi:hypothetical protein